MVGVMGADYVVEADPTNGKVERRIRTGRGAHVMFVSHNGKVLYVSNRLEGTIAVLDPDNFQVLPSIQVRVALTTWISHPMA